MDLVDNYKAHVYRVFTCPKDLDAVQSIFQNMWQWDKPANRRTIPRGRKSLFESNGAIMIPPPPSVQKRQKCDSNTCEL